MAIVAPLLLAIMMGSAELGNYFLSEHILTKGVRDGAIYAARQNISANYACGAGSQPAPTSITNNTKALVRTGQLSGGTDRLPNWTSQNTTFTVTYSCATAAGGTTLGGLYNGNSGNAPIITVTAQLPYHSVMARLGFPATNLHLNATEQAAATGI
jgi:Flp pilus assembly protein TadG